MTDDAVIRPAYLQPVGRLKPANAAAALIVEERGLYLMQLRDADPGIFFPGHWGCFGGAIEPDETYEEALNRELWEELKLDVSALSVFPFTRFTFDFGFADGGIIDRWYFVVPIDSARVSRLALGEGRAMRLFEGPDLLSRPMVPYDRFALWMHCYRRELSGEVE
ncbi:MAG: NUDIX domain-containing protein [Candidatus Binatia bacterium]